LNFTFTIYKVVIYQYIKSLQERRVQPSR